MQKQYFENIEIINTIECIMEQLGRQNYIYVINQIPMLSKQLSAALSKLLEWQDYFTAAGLQVSEEDIMDMLSDLLVALDQRDYILYGDLLMQAVYPFFIEVQNAIRNQESFFYDGQLWENNLQQLKEKDSELFISLKNAETLHRSSVYHNCVYRVEPTTVGAFTLSLCENDTTYYIHSNDNPYREARLFADAYFDVKKEYYIGFGLGLGYHWEELLKRNPDMLLEIIEPDIGVLQLAFTYMDMNWYFAHENVRIYYDPEYHILLDRTADNNTYAFLQLRAYIKHVHEDGMRSILEDCLMRENSIRQYKDVFYLNSRCNFKNCDAYIDELESVFYGKRVVLIAGGPSLDKNVMELIHKPEDTIYVAVGTVFRKLLKQGIVPDFVIVSDPKEAVYAQIRDLEQEQIPMILLSTAYRKLSQNYQGKKYLVCQKDYEEAEQYARERDYRLYQTGGSVITVALDVSIRLGACEIICIGLDLAFTGNRDHASDTHQAKTINTDGEIIVPAIGGGTVKTNRPFNIYRKWIEMRLSEKDVIMPVFDATEGGAEIKGMQNVLLRDVLKNNKNSHDCC